MIVSDNPRFIYARIPKTASTSVSTALAPYRRKSDASLIGSISRRIVPNSLHPRVINFRANSHWGLQAAHDVLGDSFKEYFTFSVARHPFEWIVSVFNHLLRNQDDEGFRKFYPEILTEKPSIDRFIISLIEDPIPPQISLLIDYGGSTIADYVAHSERLDSEMSYVFERLGLDLEIPKLNQGNYKKNSGLSDESKEIISHIYAVDMDFFGYGETPQKWERGRKTSQTEVLGKYLKRRGAHKFMPWDRIDLIPSLRWFD